MVLKLALNDFELNNSRSRGPKRGGNGSVAAAALSLQRQSMFTLKKTTKKFQFKFVC